MRRQTLTGAKPWCDVTPALKKRVFDAWQRCPSKSQVGQGMSHIASWRMA